MHLRDPQLIRDLRLGLALEEAEVQDRALPLGEITERRRDAQPLLRDLEAPVLAPDRLRSGRRRVSRRGVERVGRVRLQRVQRLEDVVLSDVGRRGDLGNRRRSAEVLPHARHGSVDQDRGLLDVARHPERPPSVSEMALQLAHDRRGGVGRERNTAFRVEAIDRVQQTERSGLRQVVDGLAPAGEAAGEVLREREELLGELFTRGRVGQASGRVPRSLPPAGRVAVRSAHRLHTLMTFREADRRTIAVAPLRSDLVGQPLDHEPRPGRQWHDPMATDRRCPSELSVTSSASGSSSDRHPERRSPPPRRGARRPPR